MVIIFQAAIIRDFFSFASLHLQTFKLIKIVKYYRRKREGELGVFGDDKNIDFTKPDKNNNTSNNNTEADNMYKITISNRNSRNNAQTTFTSRSMPVIDKRTSATNYEDDVQVVVQPLKYTSKVTAVINHVRAPSNQSRSSEDDDNSNYNNVQSYKTGPTLQSNPYRRSEFSPTRNASTLPRSNVIEAPITVKSTATVQATVPTQKSHTTLSPRRSVPEQSVQSRTTSHTAPHTKKSNVPRVVMRNKNPGYQK